MSKLKTINYRGYQIEEKVSIDGYTYYITGFTFATNLNILKLAIDNKIEENNNE